MRVGISAEFLGTRTGGTVTYMRNLLLGLAQVEDPRFELIPYVCSTRGFAMVAQSPRIRPRLVRPYNSFIRLPFTLPAEMLRRPVDLLHVQTWGPPWSPGPMLASIHDLGFERRPADWGRPLRTRLSVLVRHTARRAIRITTPSKHTADELMRLYGTPAEKIRVVHPAFDARPYLERSNPGEVARVRARYSLTEPYILSVGSIEPRKNIDKLILAYAELRRRGALSHRLVISGKPLRIAGPTLSLPASLGLEREVQFIGHVPDTDLPGLYAGATLSAFLGATEGFGYPPLEAMACGTAALTSNLAALPEVVGDAAVLVDPFRIDQVANGVERLVRDEDLRLHLRGLGYERIQRYLPEYTARQILAMYEECLAVARRLQPSSTMTTGSSRGAPLRREQDLT